MKNLIFYFALLGLLVSSVAFAELPFPAGAGKEMRTEAREQMKTSREEWRQNLKTERQAFLDDLKQRREAFITELKAKKEEWKLANTERKAMFCGAAQRMIGQRFEVAVRNLERFQTRMEELITKLNGEGKDTDAAEESLGQSKDKLDEAKDKIADIRDLIPGDCQSVTPEVWEQIKLGAREAKDLLKESHRYLVDTIQELKSLREEE